MALAQGDDRVPIGILADARRFEIGKHRPDQIFLTVAGYFTEILNDPVNHLTAAGVEIGDHIAGGGRV